MAQGLDIKKLAMIGCGSIGGGMALLFAENGLEISLEDPSEPAMDYVINAARDQGFGHNIKKFKGIPHRLAWNPAKADNVNRLQVSLPISGIP